MSEPDKLAQAVDVLLDGVPQVIADAERYKRERDEAVGLLWKVSSDEPCRFDHYGYCQEHGWFDLSVPCPEGRAQTFLARIEHDDREAARAPH